MYAVVEVNCDSLGRRWIQCCIGRIMQTLRIDDAFLDGTGRFRTVDIAGHEGVACEEVLVFHQPDPLEGSWDGFGLRRDILAENST
jgi:hypothetical protein